MPVRQTYTQQMKQKLLAWRSRFDARRSAAARPGVTINADERERLEASKADADAAFAKLAELRAAAARYIAVRGEMEALWKSIDDEATEIAQLPPISAASRRPGKA